jgi:protein SCO1/2
MPENRRKPQSAAIARLLLIAVALILWTNTAVAANDGGSVWGAGYFPNVPLISHEGQTVRFFDDMIKDKVVLINFFYSRCPDVCPLETARLREVKRILGDRVGRDVFMYSITIDPEYDTPETIKAYAEKFDVGSGWLFLTGKEADILQVRKKLAMYREDEPALSQHGTDLVLGNQGTGQWMMSTPFENPYFLASRIKGLLDDGKRPPAPEEKKEPAEPPTQLRPVSKGESIFRTRCSPCHTIGVKEGEASTQRAIGPDLFGVTEKRDRAWLERWLAAPDRMLQEKDPLAMALLAEWNNVPMPNLRLNAVEIEELLSYIEEESRAAEQNPPKQPPSIPPIK